MALAEGGRIGGGDVGQGMAPHAASPSAAGAFAARHIRLGIGNRVEVAGCGVSRTSPPRAPQHRVDTAACRDLVRREPGPEQPYCTLRRAPGNSRPFQVRQPPTALDLAVGLGEQRPHLDEGGDGRAPGAGVLAPVPAGTLGKTRQAVIRDRHRRGAG